MLARLLLPLSVLAFLKSTWCLDSFLAPRADPRTQSNTSTGDVQCTLLVCISAIVNGSTVEYVLQSTGDQQLGWMAMGFGTQMIGSPVIVMWPNADGTVTLSQRKPVAHSLPPVDPNPPRTASFLPALSTTSGTQPKLAYSILANSDTQQHVIWAFGTEQPSSAAVDASFNQHLQSGTFTLDLTKTTDLSTLLSPALSLQSGGSSPSPFTKREKVIIAHATFSAIGFIVVLPIGALVGRYLRNFNSSWFKYHWMIQFCVGGPIIIIGASLAATIMRLGGSNGVDRHKVCGTILFILYAAQASLGGVIHFFKRPGRVGRPPQNYLHPILGLIIIALAFYQVHVGYTVKWPENSNRPVPKAVNIFWLIWVVVMPLSYAVGLTLLRRQFKQERANQSAPVAKVEQDTVEGTAN